MTTSSPSIASLAVGGNPVGTPLPVPTNPSLIVIPEEQTFEDFLQDLWNSFQKRGRPLQGKPQDLGAWDFLRPHRGKRLHLFSDIVPKEMKLPQLRAWQRHRDVQVDGNLAGLAVLLKDDPSSEPIRGTLTTVLNDDCAPFPHPSGKLCTLLYRYYGDEPPSLTWFPLIDCGQKGIEKISFHTLL